MSKQTPKRLEVCLESRLIQPRSGSRRAADFLVLLHDTGRLAIDRDALELRPLASGDHDLHILIGTSKGVYMRLTAEQSQSVRELGVKVRVNVVIRKGSLADLDAIYTLGCAVPGICVSSGGAFMERDELTACLASNSAVSLVAHEGEVLGGFFHGALLGTLGFMYCLVVAPQHLRSELGIALVTKAIAVLASKGATRIGGFFDPSSPAFEMARRSGFKQPGCSCAWLEKGLESDHSAA